MVFVDGTDVFGFVLKNSLVTAEKRMRRQDLEVKSLNKRLSL